KRTHSIDHCIRIGSIANEIAEDECAIVHASCAEDGIEGLEVGMNVADDEVLHSEANPFQQPLDNLGDRTRRVDTHMCLAVRGLPPDVELLHLYAIGREGTPAIYGYALDHAFERHVEPCNRTV